MRRMPVTPVRRGQRGFTLLEVVVALAVLGVGAALALSVVSGSLGNIRKVQSRTRTVQHAESVIETVLLEETITNPTVLRGDFEDGTTWVVQVTEVQVPPPQMLPGMSQPQVNPVKLLAFSVQVMDSGSQTADFVLNTVKVVPNLAMPGGAPRVR
jgi:general secretion pathway protein I